MIKDWRGTEIKVGSKIVWPGRSGSNMWMTEGEVVEIQVKKNTDFQGKEHEVITLKVQGKNTTQYWKPKFDKLSTIHVLQRVTVISDEWPANAQGSGEVSQVPQMAPFAYPDPFEMPVVPDFTATVENKEWKNTELPIVLGKVFEKEETSEDLLQRLQQLAEKLEPLDRKRLTRTLIKKTVNFGLNDFKDS